ncbi:MAG: hypothetical protein K9L28_10075, partial [Synergistales bacterium]|nr:hypothetical protein [Synergistales bacterium]
MRRRRQHYVTASVVAAALLVCGTAAAMAPQPAPPNPDFLAYREQLEEAKQAEPRGCIPHPVNLSHLAGSSIVPLNAREEVRHYAATYDLRTLDQVPPVRNQRTYKICYAFAAQASIESSMLKQDKEKADYSEWQLAYETYNGFVTENDYPPFDRDYSVKWYHLGGVDRQAASVLARWDAPVLESDAPCGGEDPTGKGTVQKHLQKALYLPGIRNEPLDTGNAKYALVHYGAISISMFAGGMADPAVWNKETNAYYYPYDAAPATDHAVNIVGWNDNYPKENFASEPAEDGAWIVRNSWGTDWGDKGYLYISYHSAGLENGVAYTVEKTDNYDNIYQYDPLGLCQAIGFGSDTAWCANVFKTGTGRTTRGTATQGSSGERIKAVSFYSLGGSSMNPAQYTIYVYTDLPDHPDDPCNGDLWEVIDGKLEQAGYVTIPLNNAVPVSKDEVFSIVLQLTTPGYHSPIPVESPVKDYSSFATCGYKESFISPSMTDWDELDLHIDGANVCVKAFTDSLAEPATPTPTPRPATPTPTLIPTLAPQPTRAPTATPAAAPTATPTPGPVPEPEEIGSGDVEPDSEVASMDVEPLDGEDNSGAQQSAQG